MKKADITDATSQHDSVAIFEYQRGTNGYRRFVRRMTAVEYARLTEGLRSWQIKKVKNSVNVVFVQPVNSLGQTERQCEQDGITFVIAGFADTTLIGTASTLDYEMSIPLARIKRQVNATQSFAEFIIADRAAQKAAAQQRDDQAKQQRRRVRAHADRLQTLCNRLHALGHAESRVQNAGWKDISSTVEIDIDTLSALIDAAEKAGA